MLLSASWLWRSKYSCADMEGAGAHCAVHARELDSARCEAPRDKQSKDRFAKNERAPGTNPNEGKDVKAEHAAPGRGRQKASVPSSSALGMSTPRSHWPRRRRGPSDRGQRSVAPRPFRGQAGEEAQVARGETLPPFKHVCERSPPSASRCLHVSLDALKYDDMEEGSWSALNSHIAHKRGFGIACVWQHDMEDTGSKPSARVEPSCDDRRSEPMGASCDGAFPFIAFHMNLCRLRCQRLSRSPFPLGIRLCNDVCHHAWRMVSVAIFVRFRLFLRSTPKAARGNCCAKLQDRPRPWLTWLSMTSAAASPATSRSARRRAPHGACPQRRWCLGCSRRRSS